MKHLAFAFALFFAFLSATAAVPVRWTVETSRVQPAQIEAYHGETLRLEAALQSYGKPFEPTNSLYAIYWQTNGMDAAYWVGPAVISNHVLLAEWVPAMDVGATVYQGFIGAPGEIYRASFQLRLRPSPGAVPSELPLPTKTLDFAHVEVLNPPYFTQSETDAMIASATNGLESAAHAAQTYQPVGQYLTSESDPTADGKISAHDSSTSAHSDIRTALAGKQATISDLATIRSGAAAGATAVQPAAISDMETKTHAAATYQPKGSYLTTESDPSVSSWAKATVKPSYGVGEITGLSSSLASKADTNGTVAISIVGVNQSPYVRRQEQMTLSSGGIKIEPQSSQGLVSGPTVRIGLRVGDFNLPGIGVTSPSDLEERGLYFPNGSGPLALTSDIPTDAQIAEWGYIKSYTETDPTISAWAKATAKPSYTWSEIGSKPSWIGSSKPSYTWSEIGSKPTFATVATSGAYSDLSGRPTIPTALKCPNALKINLNGALAATYDGSAAKTVNITTGGGAPGGTVAAATLEYHADGQAIAVSVAAAGTFSATLTGWPDGQSQMAFVTLAAGASVSPAIKLIGYSEWTTGEEFMAVATRRNNTIFINPVCITED